MKLLTWNIQWCRGMDGMVDPARIARIARELADFDVLCLQEVARNFPRLAGSRGEDQFELLCRALRGHIGFFGVATEADDGRGGRSEFGNALFTRLPVAQVFRHLLPWPADPGVPSMQRGVIEAVLEAPFGWMRVMTTHLEYYSTLQRFAQVHALRALHSEAASHAKAVRTDQGETDSPFLLSPRPASALLCGDFNFRPESVEHALLGGRFFDGAPGFVDAWAIAHPAQPHPPTFRLYDPEWSPYCCDFVFATEDLAPRIGRMTVDAASQASDHQAVLIELAA
jgi:endonuclease/exonuclease/phosphatase family metal-dependent hydrolase